MQEFTKSEKAEKCLFYFYFFPNFNWGKVYCLRLLSQTKLNNSTTEAGFWAYQLNKRKFMSRVEYGSLCLITSCAENLTSALCKLGELFNSVTDHTILCHDSIFCTQRTEIGSEHGHMCVLSNSSKPIKQHVMWLIEPFHREVTPGRAQ